MVDESKFPSVIFSENLLEAIFPIINFIAFPKTIVPLYIFEPRYKRMVTDISNSEDQKSLILTNLDKKTNKPLDIGVYGELISQEYLSDGRSNIIVRCLQRVKIKEYFRPYTSEDYAIAEIIVYPESNLGFENKSWYERFPNLLEVFKKHFLLKTGKNFKINSPEIFQRLTAEETINAMCQFSLLDISKKIDLLLKNDIFMRAVSLEKYLSDSFLSNN
ncbi:MAG: LON peptidase substrate-binding domain-containing protein [Candidatus Thorarchaeota archaeon]